MAYIILYRKDFRVNMDDNCSFFDDVLFDLNIIKEMWADIDSIEVGINGKFLLNIYDDSGNEIS